MRADTHDGPEHNRSTSRPDTLMQLSRSLILEVHLVPRGRAIHFGTKLPYQRRRPMSEVGGRTDSTRRLYPSLSGRGPKRRSRHNNAGLMTFFTAFLSRGDVFGDERRIVADARKQCGADRISTP